MDQLSFDGAAAARAMSPGSARAYSEGVVAGVFLSIWRQRLFVILVVLAALGVAAAVLTIFPRSYHAEAMVQLDFGRRDGDVAAEQIPSLALDATAIVQSEAVVLRSRMIARRVVARLGLANEPNEPMWSAWTAFTIWLRHTSLPHPSPEDVVQAITPADKAERDLMSRLTVSADNRSYIISISYVANSPDTAARIANAVANEYLRRRAEAKLEVADSRAKWLKAQIVASGQELRDAEKTIADFRTQVGLLESAGGADSLGDQQLRGLTAQVNDATLSRLTVETRLGRVRSLVKSGAVLATSDLQDLPNIQILLQRQQTASKNLAEVTALLGPHHPSVLQANASLASVSGTLAAEVNRTVAALEANVEMSKQVERRLRDQLEILKRQTIGTQSDQTTLRNYQDKAQAIRDRLTALTRNYEQVIAYRALSGVAASLVVAADPVRYPAGPKPTTALAVALLVGLALGVTGAIILERRDHGLRSSSEVADMVNTRCLGMLPELPRRLLTGGRSSSKKNSLQQVMFDEAIRLVGAGLQLFEGPLRSRIVLVTSAVPGEGKSLFCRALGDSLAASGQRVLLIDGTPRPNSQPPANASSDDTVMDLTRGARLLQHAKQRNVVPLVSGDVFGAEHLLRLIDDARERFDVILIEGPAVMVVADTLVLARHTDTRIMLTRWSATPRASVDAALNRLRENAIVLDGLVLTRVNLGRHKRLRFFDQCSYYAQERRFYEGLAGRARAAAPAAAATEHAIAG